MTLSDLQNKILTAQGALAVRRATMLAYLKDEVTVGDHHGVQDAASDLREIDVEHRVLEAILQDIERIKADSMLDKQDTYIRYDGDVHG